MKVFLVSLKKEFHWGDIKPFLFQFNYNIGYTWA
jgi:hypothetical protein